MSKENKVIIDFSEDFDVENKNELITISNIQFLQENVIVALYVNMSNMY